MSVVVSCFSSGTSCFYVKGVSSCVILCFKLPVFVFLLPVFFVHLCFIGLLVPVYLVSVSLFHLLSGFSQSARHQLRLNKQKALRK